MRKLAIIGASGHGKVLADIAVQNGYTDIVFFDDNDSLHECGGYPIIGRSFEVGKVDADIIIGIGNADIRKKMQEAQDERKIATLIHPKAVVASDARIGAGTVVMAGAVINAGASIGKGCILSLIHI